MSDFTLLVVFLEAATSYRPANQHGVPDNSRGIRTGIRYFLTQVHVHELLGYM